MVGLKWGRTDRSKLRRSSFAGRLWLRLRKQSSLLLLVIPGLVYVFVFSYIPMAGLQLAFKDYDYRLGLWGSPWVGLSNFQFLANPQLLQVIKNTLTISFLKLFIGFPAPVILALLLNEVRNEKYKRFIQTGSYVPHFVSWVVVVGLLDSFLSVNGGVINQILGRFGLAPVFFMGDTRWFLPIVISSGIWKEIGWGTIIYLAALSAIPPELYEAAEVDGAGRWAKVRHITLPGLIPTITILLVLSMPSLISAGFDQIYPLQNPANLPVSEVLDTYVAKIGIGQGQYSITTAIGLLTSMLGFILVMSSNHISKKVGGAGIY